MTVDLNRLPCELGNPGQLPVPVDAIDGGSIENPDDDGDGDTTDPVDPIPTVWVCESVSPGVSPTGRACFQYSINSVPPGAISIHGSQADCEFECIPVVVCRRNAITSQLECLYVRRRDVLDGEVVYASISDCQVICRDDTKPPGGNGDGNAITYYVCNETEEIVPCIQTTGGGLVETVLGETDCRCRKVTKSCDPIIITYTTPEPPPPGPGQALACNLFSPPCTGTTLTLIPNSCPDEPERNAVTYYVCNEIEEIVPCIQTAGGGLVESVSVETDCRCRKVTKSCDPVVIPYTTPQPPPPGPGQALDCNLFSPPCTGTTLTLIPNTCPDTTEPNSITYYVCTETEDTVACIESAGGYVEVDPTETDCRCTKITKSCDPVVITYTTPTPPDPEPNQRRSCAGFSPLCAGTTLIPIPNTCTDSEGNSVTYYVCNTTESTIPCILTSEGYVEVDPAETDCRCRKVTKSCDPVVIPYTTPQPPEPGPGQRRDCTGFSPLCAGTTITLIPNSCIEIINPDEPTIPLTQGGKVISNYQYDPTKIDENVPTGYSFGDPTYIITNRQSNVTNFVKSSLYSDFFAEQRDIRVQNLLTSSQSVLSALNVDIASLSLTNIKQSVKKELRDILFNLTYPDGRLIPESKIAKAIKKHLLENTVDQIDIGYIAELRDRSIKQTTSDTKSLQLIRSQFGITKTDLKKQRELQKQRALAPQTIAVDTAPNQTRGVVRALQNAKPLDPSKYADQNKELLKLWYILPTDINRRILVSASGTDYPIYIQDTDTIQVTTSAGSSITVPVDRIDYSVCVTLTNSSLDYIGSYNDIDRAYTIQNEVEIATLHDVGSKWGSILTVTSPSASDLEFNYTLSGERSRYYVLKIDRSSILNVPDPDSIFTRKTKVNYTIETNAQNIRDAVEFRLYPWKVFTVNHNDPILGHFHASSTYEFEFTNFSLQQFGTKSGEQLFVRKIPELIIVLPTDKFNLNFFNGYSRLLDWNKRRLIFTASPDPRYSKTGLDQHWIKIEDTYPDTDVNDDLNVNGKKGTFTGRAGLLSLGFKTGAEQLPRKKHGFRAAVETASAINNNYVIDEGVSWSDLFIRLTIEQYKTFKIGISKTMIDKLRLGEKTGVKLLHNRNDIFRKETRLLGFRPVTIQGVPDAAKVVPVEINTANPAAINNLRVRNAPNI